MSPAGTIHPPRREDLPEPSGQPHTESATPTCVAPAVFLSIRHGRQAGHTPQPLWELGAPARATLPAVGVMDMLRFHKFTAGWYWVDDYGSADDPEEFQALLAYSPYHNIRKGTTYPPTLVTTADTDDRVVPGHSFKFAAEIQHADSGKYPQLIRIQTKAGHGAGTPTKVRIEQYVDMWGFLVKNLDMDLPGDYPGRTEGGQ